MPFVDCPRCHTSFHTGVIYESLHTCPRCGASLYRPRPGLAAWLRGGGRPQVLGKPPDWEAVTGSQYARHHVTRVEPIKPPDSSPAA